VVSKEDLDLAKENDRLRRENRILKEEREILNNYSGPQPACARYKSLCYAAPEGQLPMAYSRARPRQKTWHMGRCALESGDAASANV